MDRPVRHFFEMLVSNVALGLSSHCAGKAIQVKRILPAQHSSTESYRSLRLTTCLGNPYEHQTKVNSRRIRKRHRFLSVITCFMVLLGLSWEQSILFIVALQNDCLLQFGAAPRYLQERSVAESRALVMAPVRREAEIVSVQWRNVLMTIKRKPLGLNGLAKLRGKQRLLARSSAPAWVKCRFAG